MPSLREQHVYCRGQRKNNCKVAWCKQLKTVEIEFCNDLSDKKQKTSHVEIQGRQREPEIIDLSDEEERGSIEERRGKQQHRHEIIDLDTDGEDEAGNGKEQETWLDLEDKKEEEEGERTNRDFRKFASRVLRMVLEDDAAQKTFRRRNVRSKTLEPCPGRPSRKHASEQEISNARESELYEPSGRRSSEYTECHLEPCPGELSREHASADKLRIARKSELYEPSGRRRLFASEYTECHVEPSPDKLSRKHTLEEKLRNAKETELYEPSGRRKLFASEFPECHREPCPGKLSRSHASEEKFRNGLKSALYEHSGRRRSFASELTECMVDDDPASFDEEEVPLSYLIAQGGTISDEYASGKEPKKRRASSGAGLLLPQRKLRKVARVENIYRIVKNASAELNCKGDASPAPSKAVKRKSNVTKDGGNRCGGEPLCSDTMTAVEDDAIEGTNVTTYTSSSPLRSSSDVTRARVGKGTRSDASMKVKEMLRIFNSYYLRFVQEEEVRCCREASTEIIKSRRPDLKAITQMKADKKIVCTGKHLGNIPGIKVGDQFFSRCEMVAIGLHRHWLAGIDTVTTSSKKGMNVTRLPIASSIILSGAYEDDIDNSEDVIYTGQGGNDLLGNKRQIADQVLKRGNLALKNNMEQDMPVRLIRGHKTKNSYTGKVYTYDGLYKVKEYWAEKGISGFTVYKFRLKRVEGQPALTTDQVHFFSRQIPTVASELKGIVCADISYGLENIPIPASNIYDSKIVPEVRYIASVELKEGVKTPKRAKGCDCKGECSDPKKCSCAILNKRRFPYVKQNGGRLIEPMDVVYECGPHCGCSKSCSNRVTQKGMQYRLEVFQTANKGWGVRSWDTIPAGAPVCQYSGTLMRYEDAENISESQYILELDCLQTIKGIGSRQKRLVSNAGILNGFNVPEQPEYCIDASTCGNVSRFINHSCHPNLFIQCVLNDHHDLSQPHIWFFAADTIPPLQELNYDYGYELDSVVKDGKIKVLPCLCGAPCCRKRLY